MKALIRKIIPSFIFGWYHFILSYFGSKKYDHPSRELYIFGVTGTNGKTTVCNLIADVFEHNNKKAGCATTTNFRFGKEERLNDTKQTMLGRTKLQAILREMVDKKVEVAAIETSSEGIVQYRHQAIDYNAAVFTNLTPEHIESHGSFENYRSAKEKLFKKVAKDHPKDGIGIYNLDSQDVDHFLAYNIPQKYGFTYNKNTSREGVKTLLIRKESIKALGSSVTFQWEGKTQTLALSIPGKVNIENAMSALLAGVSRGIPIVDCITALEMRTSIPGRFEFINEGQAFDVIIDYAPEPASLNQLFEYLEMYKEERGIKRVIHITGSAGGGRDKSRRPILGRLSAQHADIVIVANEDPYEEDPKEIIEQVVKGAVDAGKVRDETLFTFLDRKEAIEFAIDQANDNDLVLMTGKGSEQAIVMANNKKIPWDERIVAREAINRKMQKGERG